MKSLVKSTLIAATFGLFAIPASATGLIAITPTATQDTVVKDTVQKEVPPSYMCLAQAEETYNKVTTDSLPETVKTAVSTKYAGYTIDEAYKSSENNYKLILKKEEAKVTVYYGETGEFKKEETDTTAVTFG